MTPGEITTMTIVDRRQAELKTAVAAGDEKTIGEAQAALDEARVSAAKETRHRAEREKVEHEVAAEKRATEKAARKKLADAVEAELRVHATPFVEFHANGKIITIQLGGAEPITVGVAGDRLSQLRGVNGIHTEA